MRKCISCCNMWYGIENYRQTTKHYTITSGACPTRFGQIPLVDGLSFINIFISSLRHQSRSPALSSAIQHAMSPGFGGKWETECLNTMFLLSTLPWRIQVKPIFFSQSIFLSQSIFFSQSYAIDDKNIIEESKCDFM